MDRKDLTAPQALWLEHLEACAAAGKSMKAYAEVNGLNLQNFYVWKGRLKRLGVLAPTTATGSGNAFVSVSMRPHQSQSSAHIKLSNGIAIEVPGSIDAQAMARLIKVALEAAP